MESPEPRYEEVRVGVDEPPPERVEVAGRPELGYILPFAVFIAFLAIKSFVAVPEFLRFAVLVVAIGIFSRKLIAVRPSQTVLSVLLGIAVFFIWIGPDVLIPGYRNSFLFSNALVGHPTASTVATDKISTSFLIFRVLVSVIAVPILEELFWRGWMLRWIANPRFTTIPIGTWNAQAFWIVAFLFASEHGSYWDVGLVTGMIYNYWAIRTHNLMDCIIAHAATNACLAAYVIGWNQWQFWL